MFDGFTEERCRGLSLDLLVRHAGAGPPVLLLHGHPRTSSTWHRVAPRLVDMGLTVVCADLPGYGRSEKPAPVPDHAAHSKRAGARELVAMMQRLGHERFTVAGHDRGALYAFRAALEYPESVTAAVIMDAIPVSEHLDRCDARFATAYWHWFFFAQPKTPERVITADPDSWYVGDPDVMGAENYAEFRTATRDPTVVRGMLEDYRAGLVIDRAHDEADRAAGRRVACPVLMLWSEHDDLEDLHGDPIAIWRAWADDVSGHTIASGHHMAEQAPEAVATAIGDFVLARPGANVPSTGR
jgi:haloacetate dehalogenase